MTVSSTDNRNGPYTGNGATTSFAWTFKVLDADTLKVYETIDGVTSEVTTGITKNGVPGTSGTVVFSTPPATGTLITLIRESDYLQSSDYAAEGRITPEQVEDDLDRSLMSVQDLLEKLGRALKFDVSSSLTEVTVPEPVDGAILGWNASDELVNLTDIGQLILQGFFLEESGATAEKGKWEIVPTGDELRIYGRKDDGTRNGTYIAIEKTSSAFAGLVGGINRIKVMQGATEIFAFDAEGYYIKTLPIAVSALPAASSANRGGRAMVADANSTTFASIVAGGGSNYVPVYSDGTNWRIG